MKIDMTMQLTTKNINLLTIPFFLFSVLMNSFNIISRINENIHTVNISLNKLNYQNLKIKTNIKIVVIIFIYT